MAGSLGRELAGEAALTLAAFDDRVHLRRRSADDGLAGGGVDAHLQAGEIREHLRDLVGGVFDQSHQPDVLAEQHRLALAHEMGTGTDGSGGIRQREPTGEVCGSRLAEGLPHHCGGFGTVVFEQLPQGDLDGEDHQLHDFDRILTGLVGVVD